MSDIEMPLSPIEIPAEAEPAPAAGRPISEATTFTLVGVEARTVSVEVSVCNGYPRTAIVGLPDASVRESRERVEAALKASQLPFPDRRIIINLSPAELQKEGTAFDLPLALALLAGQGKIPRDAFDGWAIAGELSLDGSVRRIRGVLAMALALDRMLDGTQPCPSGVATAPSGIDPTVGISTPGSVASGTRRPRCRFLVPFENAVEAASVSDRIEIVPVAHLREAVEALLGNPPDHPMPRADAGVEVRTPSDVDLADLRGQPVARRALEVAIAGGHNMLLIGPPGSGKTLLAQRAAGILPPMTRIESIETTLIYSVAGLLKAGCGLIETRPFRAPHSSISRAAMVGGGERLRPGEVSLAHNGVLFLDEMPEFAPSTLNLLRQPLEDGRINVARIHGGTTYPARFTLITAMNPCPCGFLGDAKRACVCPPLRTIQYRARVSGPLLDRIDLHVEMPRVSLDAIASDRQEETSASVRSRVIAARRLQAGRFESLPGIHCNGQMGIRALRELARMEPRATGALRRYAERLGLSGRGYHRIIRVARTIADLGRSETIAEAHIMEAVGYRLLDRKVSAIV